jgi:hypothetical protein
MKRGGSHIVVLLSSPREGFHRRKYATEQLTRLCAQMFLTHPLQPLQAE